jgi:phosphatidylinositol glycan class B
MRPFPAAIRNERFFFAAVLIIYLITAWNSDGWYHSDEHYTILEYAMYKMGEVSPEGLTWEFDAGIKPAFLAFLAFWLLKIFGILGMQDPYMQAFLMRSITAITAVLIIRFFIRRSRYLVDPGLYPAYRFFSYFLWFLPVLNVRFMPESLSGLVLPLTLAVLLNQSLRIRDHILAGALLGIGFLVRFPHGIFAIGIFSWLLFIRKEKISSILPGMLALLLVTTLGLLADFWLYGKFEWTAWNYFKANIIGDTAEAFGTEAWWNYFYSIFRFLFFPIGTIVLLSFILVVVKQRRSLVVWTILPYFVIHSMIPHKELRYLFPLANLVPLLLMLAYQEIRPWLGRRKEAGRMVLRSAFLILFLINLTAVFTVSLKPSNAGLMSVTRYIRQEYGDQPIRLISFNGSNPYEPAGTTASFYMEEDMQNIRLESLNELHDSLLHKGMVNLLVLRRKDAQSPVSQKFIYQNKGCKAVQALPEWMEPLMTLYGGYRLRDIRELYEIFP